MTWTDGATWVGTGLALISMGVAIWQARQAKSAAAHAEEMRNDIASRAAHSELSGLNGRLAAAIRAMDKYGPGAGRAARRGNSPESDAATVREVTGKMVELRDLLVKKFGNEVGDVITKVNELLIDFAEAPNPAEQLKHGGDIYNEILEFRGNIKKVLDRTIYG